MQPLADAFEGIFHGKPSCSKGEDADSLLQRLQEYLFLHRATTEYRRIYMPKNPMLQTKATLLQLR